MTKVDSSRRFGTIYTPTSQPNLEEARKFAESIHAKFPDDVTQVIAGGKSSTTALRGSTEEAQFH